ncbi:Methylase of chemotaxis methyl-accepting proteins [Ralstonia mannitolilytica]|uniref:Chemotaxis protein methyltransferase n=2 Tax=Ralstonia mannitolilytica TaxID=105219 RepID=A0AAJ4ZNT5_9RALS|nr:Chemotaxis protein methyltransferase [Ralstonia mannitolilytica]CAJ0732333.1 Chemotaxis protein methyltransferase [Ralstonia mannitolilytica]CAJ0733279.1 Chemotaxis protein methyltransferase [Ralstonia mannitolilytica]CAJ0788962.1 Chemotaxis protein methyltransferase [Ralstonia mannitolilytica]SUE24523.1 Chemotaxis protein methyltransferase [Ralstonia mannitolilytica]
MAMAHTLAPVSPTLASREFSFTAEDFARIRGLIYRRAGISLSDRKSEMVYSRLARRLRVVNLGSFRDYLDALENGHLPDEWEAFTNALTTNLTAFFREQHHFPILAEHAKAKRTPFTVWCSASSTGEEPYSIAITLAETFGSMHPGQVSVIASDVDTNALARARAGIYPMERVAALSTERLKKYFLRGTGKHEGYARVRPELQAMIDFRQINLLDRDWPLTQKFDVIFCRNVMIYFDKPTQAKILEHFIDVMKPDGLLFAGHSESFLQISKAWSLRGKTVYEIAPDVRAKMAGAR